MKIDIKPTIVTVSDYHNLCFYDGNTLQLGLNIHSFELGGGYYSGGPDFYKGIAWVAGSEDELFEFIFTNKEAWGALTNE